MEFRSLPYVSRPAAPKVRELVIGEKKSAGNGADAHV